MSPYCPLERLCYFTLLPAVWENPRSWHTNLVWFLNKHRSRSQREIWLFLTRYQKTGFACCTYGEQEFSLLKRKLFPGLQTPSQGTGVHTKSDEASHPVLTTGVWEGNRSKGRELTCAQPVWEGGSGPGRWGSSWEQTASPPSGVTGIVSTHPFLISHKWRPSQK